MPRFAFHCWSCDHVIETDSVFRSDSCPECDADVKACKNCRHYDAHASSGCRETSADFVYDKERANHCEYFSPRSDRIEQADEAADARAKLEALFKK